MNPELQTLLDQLGITPEDLASMFEAGVYPERAGVMNDQMGMAAQQMNAPTPEMRQVGRVAIAAAPLEMLATGLGRIRGLGQMKDLMGQRSSLIDLLRKGNQTGGLLSARDRMGMGGMAEPVPALWDPQSEEEALIRALKGE